MAIAIATTTAIMIMTGDKDLGLSGGREYEAHDTALCVVFKPVDLQDELVGIQSRRNGGFALPGS